MSSCRLIVVKRFNSTDSAQAFADKITEDGSESVTINPECSFYAQYDNGIRHRLKATDHYSAAIEMLDLLDIKIIPEVLQ